MNRETALALDVAARDRTTVEELRAALAVHKRREVPFEDAWRHAVDAVTPRGVNHERNALEATRDAWAGAYEQPPRPKGKTRYVANLGEPT